MPNQRHTAIHEAGHAVIAYRLGADLNTLTIVPAGATLGAVSLDWFSSVSPTDADQRVRDCIAISLAGRAAVEVLVSVANAGDGCDKDDRDAYEWAQILGGYHPRHAPQVGAIIAEEWARTVRLVAESRAAIATLAKALQRAKTLDGLDAWAIIDDAMNHRERIA